MNEAPEHYPTSCIEPVDVIETWDLNFNLGNAIKYIARAGRKPLTGDEADRVSQYEMVLAKQKDLQKAIDYLYREIHGWWPWDDERLEDE